jgi:ChrR Cupin-like domain
MFQIKRKFPQHSHIGGEEFLVLDGTFHDQYGSFPTGSYVRNPIGTEHAPWVEDDGCTIMVKLLQMADSTPPETDKPIHVQWDQAKTTIGQLVEYGTFARVYSNDRTGEIVEICWVDPNAMLPADMKCVGGEELFIISGSLEINDKSYGTNEKYHKWGWIRFPPKIEEGTWRERQPLIAGATGAIVYRKTGHLTERALEMEKIQIKDDESVMSS